MTGKTGVKLLIAKPFPADAVLRFTGFEGIALTDALSEAEIMMGQPAPEELQHCGKLKWLQLSSAGADRYVRCPELFREIRLTTVSGAFGQSIAEWTLAMTMSLYKHLNLFRDNQNLQRWRDAGEQFSPEGRRVLILGCGDLGTSIAEMFKRFHCRIIGLRKHPSLEKPVYFDEIRPLEALEEELPEAEIVIGSLPETRETQGLLDERRLSLLSGKAILINVGRGSLIDLDALAERLESGSLYGAALDVTHPEPLPPEHLLWRIPSCILTPHASGGSFGHLKATEEKIYEICRENLRRYLAGEALLNQVDFTTGYRSEQNRYQS